MKKLIFIIVLLLFVNPAINAQTTVKYGVDKEKSFVTYAMSHPLHEWEATSKNVLSVLIYNPDAKRRSEAKRRSLKIGNGHSEYTEVDVLNTYGLSCHLCGVDVDLSASRLAGRGNWKYGLNLDHVIPVSKGGSDTLENVRPSHVLCNIKKGNR